ncbi:MAG: ABC transporter ATP-binding protein [Gammaproteobacteria bacterium]|nr:ABC transporter ATP-binding protein [Gammaproteobacteria bacterium]
MSFGGVRAVTDVSFSMEPGTVVGFLGPNGAGKTTTMRMLTGYLRPQSGSVSICGFDLQKRPRDAQQRLGYVPESASGFAHLTVGEFLTFCAEARDLKGSAIGYAVARVCELIEIRDALGTVMRELSKGWRQRAWFAQALLHDPPVLILDEPTDGLDPNQKRQVRALIRNEISDKCVLLSTHILEEAEQVCQRAIIVAEGRIVADELTDNLADTGGRLAEAFYRLTAPGAMRKSPSHGTVPDWN